MTQIISARRSLATAHFPLRPFYQTPFSNIWWQAKGAQMVYIDIYKHMVAYGGRHMVQMVHHTFYKVGITT